MEIQHKHRKIMIVLITLFILAVVVAGGALGYFWYKKAHPEHKIDTSASSGAGGIAINTAEKVETEDIQTALVIPASTDKPGDQIKVSTLSMTVPKLWRTTNAKNVLNTGENQAMYITALNDVLAQLIMVPESKPTDPLQAINGLSFYNTAAWLKQPTKTANGTFTPAMKTAWLANIENIGNGQPANPAVCKNGAGVVDMSLCSNQLKATPITTKDGSLKGVAFLNTGAQSVSYDPRALIFLTGKVKDQQILAFGTFHLLDNTSHTVSINDTNGTKSAWDSYVAGNVPDDTMQLYKHVTDAIKSISIQTN
jgi:hypothetical protein